MEQQTSTDPRGEVQDLLARIAQLADDGTVEESSSTSPPTRSGNRRPTR